MDSRIPKPSASGLPQKKSTKTLFDFSSLKKLDEIAAKHGHNKKPLNGKHNDLIID